MLCTPNRWGENASYLLWTEIIVIFNDKCCSTTICSSKRDTLKRELLTQKRTLSRWTACEDRLQKKNLTMLFLAYVPSFLGPLHFTRNQKKILRSNSYFFGATTSSEKLPFYSSYFFKTLTSSQQLFFKLVTYLEQS